MDIRDVIKAAQQQGWIVETTARNHWKFVPPSREQGGPFYHSGTPSDVRAIRNLISMLRRAGLVYPYKPSKGDN